ncbi:MAG: hypothetical protein NTZ78_01275 [Candidatus Aureabacteria bacterium]|nr:hypothetical protein [Candidatus Auribacterota bacterium]
MKRAFIFSLALIFGALCAGNVRAQVYNIIHNFGDPAVANDGLVPWSDLVSDGSKLYGMTMAGGANGAGTVFSMNSDGSGYARLHDFPDPAIASDGGTPFGNVIIQDNVLYGMTVGGGAYGGGILFSVNTNGSGYTKIHDFLDPAVPNDGAASYGSLIADSGVFYGMTMAGGGHAGGTIFSIEGNGSDYTRLHDFLDPAFAPDGAIPWGNLILVNGALYGMNQAGGANGVGTVFSVNTNGSGYAKLHSFNDPAVTAGDGMVPFGSLVYDGTALYGMTYVGGSGWAGAAHNGAIFSMEPDGSGYAIIHNFTTGGSDGQFPWGSLTLVGSTLYGMTSAGGAYGPSPGNGALFSLNTDGSDFTIVHSFADAPGDGAGPHGSLILDGSTLYGMTMTGGIAGSGVAFSYALPTPTPTPTPQAEALLNGTSFTQGNQLAATFRLNGTIDRSFTAYALVILPDGAMLNTATLKGPAKPIASEMRGLAAPFTFPLLTAVIPAGQQVGTYEILVAFFDPLRPITSRSDDFLEASATFTLH